MIELNVKFLPYEKIAEEALNFLVKYHPEITIPIPIDEIIELDLGIDIVPTPNLQRDYDIDGFTSSNLKFIYVDDFVFSKRPYRYRFTLAHELGHILLHKKFFEAFHFNSVSSWEEFVTQVDPHDYDRLETQCYHFSGLILVPPKPLRQSLLDNLDFISPDVEKAKSAGIERNQYLDYVKNGIASKIAPFFEVSTDVIVRRIELGKLEELIP